MIFLFVMLSTVGVVGLTKFKKELFFIFKRIFFYDRLIFGFFFPLARSSVKSHEPGVPYRYVFSTLQAQFFK